MVSNLEAETPHNNFDVCTISTRRQQLAIDHSKFGVQTQLILKCEKDDLANNMLFRLSSFSTLAYVTPEFLYPSFDLLQEPHNR
jgi:hypothetical protein